MEDLGVTSDELAAFLGAGGLIELAEGSYPPPPTGTDPGGREGGTSR